MNVLFGGVGNSVAKKALGAPARESGVSVVMNSV